MKESLGRATNKSLLSSITDVLTHSIVVSPIISRDGTGDVVVDVNSVDEDIFSDIEGDGPDRRVLVDSLELLGKLLSLCAGTLAILDILAETRGDSPDLLDGRDVGVRFEVIDGSLNFAGDGLGISYALYGTLNSTKDSIEETFNKLFSTVS